VTSGFQARPGPLGRPFGGEGRGGARGQGRRGRGGLVPVRSGVLEIEHAIIANAVAVLLAASIWASVPGDLQARREP
jgi:hypothetical protein